MTFFFISITSSIIYWWNWVGNYGPLVRLETSNINPFCFPIMTIMSIKHQLKKSSYSTNTHTYTNHTIQKCLIAFFKMLPLNKESKLQMKINLFLYISHQENYYALQTWLVKSWTGYRNQTFLQSTYCRLIINSLRIPYALCKDTLSVYTLYLVI